MNRIVTYLIGAAIVSSGMFDAPFPPVRPDSVRSDSQQSSISGTYRLILCKTTECAVSDTLRAVAWGELVLGDTDIPASLRTRFPDEFLSGTANGCYALRRRSSLHSLAGLEPDAVTFWDQDASKIRFTLYSSPDAGHVVQVVMQGDTLHGTGTSWETPEGEGFTTDFVRAVRIGPADFSRCHPPKARARGV